MNTAKEWIQTGSGKANIKIVAGILLVVLLLSILGQLIAVFSRYQLVSPLIPESTIWQITKRFIFIALVSAISSIIGLLLYFYGKYVWVIILAVVILVVERFIYI